MLTGGGGGGGEMDYHRAQVVKYLWRMLHKCSPLMDAKKADFYMHRLISKLEQPE